MNREALVRVLEAAEIRVDGRWNVARLRTLFAENRVICEQLLNDPAADDDDDVQAAENNAENTDENNDENGDGHVNGNLDDNRMQTPPPVQQQQQPLAQQTPPPPPQVQAQPAAQQQPPNQVVSQPSNQIVQQPPIQLLNAPQQPDETERQLLELRRRHEILRLQREIAAMERGENVTGAQTSSIAAAIATPTTSVRKVNFNDIEHAIIKFSGEDRTYNVADFIAHLEQIFQQVNADELLKYLALRNSLQGTARLLLTRGALTYDELKANLVEPSVVKKFIGHYNYVTAVQPKASADTSWKWNRSHTAVTLPNSNWLHSLSKDSMLDQWNVRCLHRPKRSKSLKMPIQCVSNVKQCVCPKRKPKQKVK